MQYSVTMESIQHALFPLIPLLSITFLLPISAVANPIGICYGRVANNLPPPWDVVNLLRSNGISRVRLFDTDPDTLRSFAGTGIQLTIGIPNHVLPSIADGTLESCLQWLQSNIFAYVPAAQVRYIAVGNEIFLKDTNNTPFVVPAIYNLYQALQTLGFAATIKVSTPLVASVLSVSYPPSAATFDADLRPVVVPLLQFLRDSGSPLMVNAYPYISYAGDGGSSVPLDYALFQSEVRERDGDLVYENLFDATVDAFVAAMEREGFTGVPVVVTETGWPTAGGGGASEENALAFNRNVVRRVTRDMGTPKRPGVGLEVYLFGAFDENEKSGNEYEKHFGVFRVDGEKAYDILFT